MKKSRLGKSIIHDLSDSVLGKIIVLTGARQVGKTTLLKNLFPDYTYITLDEPQLRKDLISLTASQWAAAYPRAIIDEIQKLPELFDLIKAVYDREGDERYIITGSSQLLLLKQVKESLAGRCTILELFPLTLPEQLTTSWDVEPTYSYFQKEIMGIDTNPMPIFRLEKDYEIKLDAYQFYLKFGGYPALIANKLSDNEKYSWLKNYIKTYLERDIRDIADFKNLEPFITLQQICAINTGNLINYSSLAREAGIQPNTAQRFMQYLTMSYQAILLQPWYRNSLKRLSKMPKVHLLDPGIQRILVNNRNEMLHGSEFESAIVSEIYKQIQYLEVETKVYHLRTSDGREVDMLIETENGYYAIEIKLSSKVSHTDGRHLRDLDLILDKPILKSFIISNDPKISVFDKNITAMHAAHFLS